MPRWLLVCQENGRGAVASARVTCSGYFSAVPPFLAVVYWLRVRGGWVRGGRARRYALYFAAKITIFCLTAMRGGVFKAKPARPTRTWPD